MRLCLNGKRPKIQDDLRLHADVEKLHSFEKEKTKKTRKVHIWSGQGSK